MDVRLSKIIAMMKAANRESRKDSSFRELSASEIQQWAQRHVMGARPEERLQISLLEYGFEPQTMFTNQRL